MTVDEVIAANVRRIRQDKRWGVTELARRLEVGRHIVYDYERPRVGGTQRAFLWSDLVHLCDVLEVTLFELVLPDPGISIHPWTLGPDDEEDIRAAAAALSDDPGPVVAEFLKDGRTVLGEMLFGAAGGLKPEDIKTLATNRRQQADRAFELFRPLMEEALARIIESEDEK